MAIDSVDMHSSSRVSVGGVVEAWIDFDGDYVWQATEQIFAGYLLEGMHVINFVTPASAIVGQTFGRFRISSAGGLSPEGYAPDGEVEDHEVYIQEAQTFKWLQRPDLAGTGMDVEATEAYFVADDFECTESGRITEILIWGSWFSDILPWGNPEQVDFTLKFHADIPANENPEGYSIPGDILWQRDFQTGEFEVSVAADSIWEGWMTPPEEYIFPGDRTCWLYAFDIEGASAFFQEGTPDSPVVYWLVVQAQPHDIDADFGWKTSIQHWNDAAVWGRGSEPYTGPWYELRYPPMHGWSGQAIDLAFRLTNDPLSGVPESGVTQESLALYNNVPNPFSSTTTIRYSLPSRGRVKIDVFDVTGRAVTTLVDKVQESGTQTATWSGRDHRGRKVPAGIYFYRLTVGDLQTMRKMLYLK